MADHSLFDNTQAQEQQTEALQAATRAIEDLAQTLEEQARDYAARRFQQEGASAPTPEAVSFAAMAQAAKQLGHQGLAQVYGKNFSDALNAAKSASAPVAPTTPPPPQENYYQAYLREKREQAQVNAPPPPPPQTPPPPAETVPPPQQGRLVGVDAEEEARMQAQLAAQQQSPPPPQTPPLPDEEERPRYLSHDLFKQYMQHREEAEGPKLTRTVNELNRRIEALVNAYQQGAAPGDIAAQGLRRNVREQEGYLAQQYARLSPEEREQHAPLMQGVEQQRKRLEEEEVRRRRELNQELSHGEQAFRDFTHGLSRGSTLGMGANFSMGALGALVAYSVHQEAQRLEHGNRVAYPGLAHQRDVTRDIADLEESIQRRGRQALTAEDRMNQARAEAQRQGALPFGTDPRNITGIGAFHIGGLSVLGGAYGYLRHGFNPNAYNEYRADIQRRFYESRIRNVGGQQPQYLSDQPIFNIPGIHSRLTTGEQYEMSIGNAAIESSGQQAELVLLRRQLEQANAYLRQISGDTSHANPPAFGD